MSTPFLGSLVSRVGGVIRTVSATALEPVDLTPRTFGLLVRLADDGPHTQTALCAASNIDRTTMVATIDTLEERGLVERRRDAADRRVNLVALTDAGKAVVDDHQSRLRDIEQRVLEPLDPEERSTLIDLLQRIVDDLDPEEIQS